MSSDSPAISVQGLSKSYRIRSTTDRPVRTADAFRKRLHHPLRRAQRELFEALTDVNLDVAAGEAVGIVGRNGAGKSTLLKVISRITRPTTGRVELRGRIGSLLEVGTGFHGELTGRENIYLNGAILGMRKREIRRNFDSIVEFAEIQRFLDTPVKRYSSGMYVRLAFAVAAHLNPDILIVDEVLAVGDYEFQKRSLGKMGDVTRNQGRTVLFVSHNMAAIQSFCGRCIHLEEGRVAFDGDTLTAVEQYVSTGQAQGASPGIFDLSNVPRSPSHEAIFRRAELRSLDGNLSTTLRMGEGFSLALDVEGLQIPRHSLMVRIRNLRDIAIVTADTLMRRLALDESSARQDRVILTIPQLSLLAGQYWIEVEALEGRGTRQLRSVDKVDRAVSFEVVPTDIYRNGYQMGTSPEGGLVFVEPDWEVQGEGLVLASSLKQRT